MKRLAGVLAFCLLLTGCGSRELEERRFLTVLTAGEEKISEVQERKQEMDDRYRDFGQVKAVILLEQAVSDEETLREILLYLEENPAFARNLLMFLGDEGVLEYAEQKEGELGLCLEDLCKNRPEETDLPITSLKDMLNYLHNGEEVIRIPRLRLESGKIFLDGTGELKQEVVEVFNLPVPRKTND